ncbi:MAG: hypothetical protein AB8C95_13285 [Phycisphaeraceae bacterium]
MANSRKTLVALGSAACLVALATVNGAIQFVSDGNDDAIQMTIAIVLVMAFIFLTGVCAIMFGVRGSAPEWIRNIIGIDEAGRSVPTGDALKDKEISPLWALIALCVGFFVLLFLYYFVTR